MHDESSRRALETHRPPPLFAPVGARTDHIQNPSGAANLAVRTSGTLSGDAAPTSHCESRTTPQWLLEWLYQSRARTPGERAPAAPGGSAARTTHQYQEAYVQQQRLRELLGFRALAFPQAVVAEVVGIDPSPWSEVVTINKGSRDSLRKDIAVATHQGLVGRTIEMAPHYATVLLLTDRRSAVDALIQRTRARGIVVGKTRRLCELRYVDLHADIQVGDTVVASGLGEVYPKGLLIGTVAAVHQKPQGLFHEVEVQPAVDLAQLEEVLVLVP